MADEAVVATVENSAEYDRGFAAGQEALKGLLAGLPLDALMSGEMVAVPKEPTGEMLVAASRAADNGNGSAGWGKVYRAMLAAAPWRFPSIAQ